MKPPARLLLVAALLLSPAGARAQAHDAGSTASACARFTTFWDREFTAEQHLDRRIAPPAGHARKPVPASDPFAAWLRHLPLRDGQPRVRHFDGTPKGRQDVAEAVIDIDAGKADLQQCADTILRLRAEWLWSAGNAEALAFKFTSGDLSRWSDWAAGIRPRVSGSKVTFVKVAAPDAGRASFRKWLDSVFTYAGTLSLERDLKAVSPEARIEAGDVFVSGGSPGHAMIVVDVVEHRESGERMFLLAQGYMPAQDAHVVVNPATPGSPWYPERFGASLETPEWSFEPRDRHRF